MPIEINGKRYYRTSEVCNAVGISRATLFRWLREGLLEMHRRDRRGWRLYSDDDIKKLKKEITQVIET